MYAYLNANNQSFILLENKVLNKKNFILRFRRIFFYAASSSSRLHRQFQKYSVYVYVYIFVRTYINSTVLFR